MAPGQGIGQRFGGEVHPALFRRDRGDRQTDVRQDRTGDHHGAFAGHQLFGDFDRFTGVALIVAEDEFERAIQHTAIGVDFLKR